MVSGATKTRTTAGGAAKTPVVVADLKVASRAGPLTPQLIAETALRIAGEKGVQGISTRKLGEALGYAHTAVYLHFPTRNDLLKAVFDLAVSRAPSAISREGDWEDRVRAVCAAIRRTLLDHPVCYELAQRFPGRGIGSWADDMLSIARGAGYADADSVAIGRLLSEVSVGLASNSAHKYALATSRAPDDQVRPEERELVAKSAQIDDEAVFDTVVDCIIDGLRRGVKIARYENGAAGGAPRG
jgi:AcrR family transcriptional regulator